MGIGDSEGAILEEFDITHDREGFERFFSRVGACQEPDPKAKARP